ncbi:MAG: metallophosphoesterase family protein [Deltaproteobacteria bacterium]|nr:metallophosphoesterase family protein [Deltaproteobacteria bacterium]
MSHDRTATHKQLSNLWRRNDITILATKDKKYAIISDIHLGNGGRADDARHNEGVIITALRHYKKHGYILIVLGDCEDFWQFDLKEIIARYHNTVYKAIRAFGDNRVYRVFGNHDLTWRLLPDPLRNNPARFGSATEAIKMKDGKGNVRLLLVHGHQGDKGVTTHPWWTRFVVRLYRFVEPYVKIDRHTSATRSQITKNYERIMYSWAKRSQTILICGHSHRAIFASKSHGDRLREEIAALKTESNADPTNTKLVKKNSVRIKQYYQELQEEKRKKRDINPAEALGNPFPCYFNTGCALYTDGITVFEIADGELRLTKWHKNTRRRPPFEIYGKGSLNTFIKVIGGYGRGKIV